MWCALWYEYWIIISIFNKELEYVHFSVFFIKLQSMNKKLPVIGFWKGKLNSHESYYKNFRISEIQNIRNCVFGEKYIWIAMEFSAY